MTIQEELLSYLIDTYGDIAASEPKEGNYRYAYAFDYAPHPMALTVDYLTKESEITITLRFMNDYTSLVEDEDKAHKILMYLDVFYGEPRVKLIDGKLTIKADYVFTPSTFNIDAFSSKLDTIEQMSIEVNDMLTTEDFYRDYYLDALYSGKIFEEKFKGDTLFDQ